MAYYFVSDVHAGLVLNGVRSDSGERLIAWLEKVASDADAIFLLGDVFDFWFEYKHAIPSGYDALLGKLRELTQRGVEIHFFPGNHDMWIRDYLSRECGLILHRGGWGTTLCGKNVYMEHGDIQSVGSFAERLMQAVFRSRIARKIGTALIPHQKMMRFGDNWSSSSRAKHLTDSHLFRGADEGVVRFAREHLKKHKTDLFIFGHLHTPAEFVLSEHSTLYVLGGWVESAEPVYGRLDENGFSLLKYKS